MTTGLDIDQPEQLHSNWNYPTSYRVGTGRLDELADACLEQGIKKPLIVTDQGLRKLDFIEGAHERAQAAGLEAQIFSDVQSNPTGENVDAGVAALRAGDHDGIITIGGGSALDAGKAIALMAGQSRPLWEFEDVGDNWRRADSAAILPIIALPTTAGTGSEVGRASVILDTATKTKKIIFHPKMLPSVVIADPALTVDLPAPITAATGIDALTHCLEAYFAKGYHPMADGIALEGIRLIKSWLPVAFLDGAHLVARTHMLVASSMGATAFQKGLGAVHALAHPLGALYDKHHGLLNAILLPYVLKHNEKAISERAEHVARLLELPDPSFSTLLDWVLAFRQQLGIPHDLGVLGIDLNDKKKVGEMAVEDPSAMGNPVELTSIHYSELFEKAVSGHL